MVDFVRYPVDGELAGPVVIEPEARSGILSAGLAHRPRVREVPLVGFERKNRNLLPSGPSHPLPPLESEGAWDVGVPEETKRKIRRQENPRRDLVVVSADGGEGF